MSLKQIFEKSTRGLLSPQNSELQFETNSYTDLNLVFLFKRTIQREVTGFSWISLQIFLHVYLTNTNAAYSSSRMCRLGARIAQLLRPATNINVLSLLVVRLLYTSR